MKNYWLEKNKEETTCDIGVNVGETIKVKTGLYFKKNIYYAHPLVENLEPVWVDNRSKLKNYVIPFSVVVKHCGELFYDDGSGAIRDKRGLLVASIYYHFGILKRKSSKSRITTISYEYDDPKG